MTNTDDPSVTVAALPPQISGICESLNIINRRRLARQLYQLPRDIVPMFLT